MGKKTFYQISRAMLFGITLFAFFALAPRSSFVAKALDEPVMPQNDARVLPTTVKSRQSTVERYLALAPDPSYAPGYYDTSVYMLGDVSVGIILPESTGNGENWTAIEKNKVINEIQTSLNWWKTTGGALAGLTFEYDIQLDVPTTYEPINERSSNEGLWISEVMSNLGYTTGDYWEKVYAYENDLRNQHQTDWAFTIFVVDSSNDIDDMFTDGYFAYAYIGGPFMVMTYDNGGWGIDAMDRITAHETGHIFMAGDQYGSCSTSTKYGYLGIVNGNCNGSSSIMKDNTLVVDSFAKGQIGWQDSDSDTIPDILDTVPVVTLDPYSPNPTINTTLSYDGYVKNPVYPHAVCGTNDWCYLKDVTTQSIKNVNYQVDSGAWNPASAQDGSFDEDVENFSFTTKSLTPGNHSLKLTAENSSGNVSLSWNDTVLVNAPTPAAGTGKYDDTNAGWTYSAGFFPLTTTGPYAGTLHYASTVGASASFQFTGPQVVLTYTANNNRGKLDVYVDGSFVDTIYEYAAVRGWQTEWASSDLGAGTHTVEFRNAGPAGTIVDIDAIEIRAYQPPGLGKYDDTYVGWVYSAGFSALTTTGPYAGTLHYANVVDEFAKFEFTGSQFVLTYTANNNRGALDVYIDGGYVDTIDEYAATPTWQTEWASGNLGAGAHTVEFRNAGPVGSIVDIDAIEIREYPQPMGAGKYDDIHAGWAYSAGFSALTTTGPYDDTLHYASAIGEYATFSFTESQFVLTYTANINRGTLDVYVDGVYVDTINEYAATRVWQTEWASADLGAGPHTVKLVNAGPVGAIVDIDAIEIRSYQPPRSGKYDDTHIGWAYSAGFSALTITGPYNGTLHYANVVGESATFEFTGSKFTLVYTAYSNRGKLDVYVDGDFVATIDEYAAVREWQASWASGDLGAGAHTVEFVHVGPVGSIVDIDAIEIFTVEPVDNDDFDAPTEITMGLLPFTDTIIDITRASKDIDDPPITACETGQGDYSVWYTFTPAASGAIEIDTFGSDYDTVVAVWTGSRTNLNSVDCNDDYIGPNGRDFRSRLLTFLEKDTQYFIEVAQIKYLKAGAGKPVQAPTPTVDLVLNVQYAPMSIMGINKYDDAHAAWVYSAGFPALTTAGPYDGTLHYSNTIGESAMFGFDGSQFLLTYTSNNNRGKLNVFVDGNYVDTINEYAATQVWQTEWASGNLGAGPHIVEFVDASGTIVDIDAIEIRAYQPPGLGKYDDTHLGWTYSAGFYNLVTTGPYAGTLHYANVVGESATFDFTGSQFVLTYTANTNRGSFDVYVDGGYVNTIDEYAAAQAWQAEWASGDLGAGAHTVEFRNVGPVGSIVDIDAIEIKEYPQPMGAGKYDDTHVSWSYSIGFPALTTTGPYDGTLHYSNTVGEYATFSFTESQFVLIYTANSNRGKLAVYVDGVYVDTINEYAKKQVWQTEWASGDLGAGPHIVKFVDVSGTIVDIDAIEIRAYQPPGAGKYDDTHASWAYSAGFSALITTGPYNGTLHYANVVGASATFEFTGSQFTLTYTGNTNRGSFDVYVDGGFVATINEYAAVRKWQAEWTSGNLGAGPHTVEFRNMSPNGTIVDIDAIEIIP